MVNGKLVHAWDDTLDTDFCRIRKETRKCSIYLHRNWIFTDVLLFPVMTLICLLPLHFYKTCVLKYVSGRIFMWGKKEILEFSLPSLLCCGSLWPWPSQWLGQRRILSWSLWSHLPRTLPSLAFAWKTWTEKDHLPSIIARNKPVVVKLIVPWFARQS